jgi:class 3 adenylate cyclase
VAVEHKIDVRDILPTIHVPTLIIQRTGDRWVKVEEGRYLANRIAGARYVELVGDDHLIWGADSDRLVDEMQTFLARPQPIAPNERVLLVVLSAEIVGSPSIPASVGDHEPGDWMQALDEDIRDELDRAEGREIKRTRGGLLAVFKRPTRALQCAMAIRRRVNASGLLVRAAVHIGECEVCGDDVTGSAIQTTSRLLDRARPGEIIASRTVRDIVIGSGLTFDARGEMKHDDAVGAWPFYSVGAPASETPQ